MKRQKRTLLHKRIREMETAIKLHCYECNCGVKKTDCEAKECNLYSLRPFKTHSQQDKQNIYR